ncbi:tRNA pseudouridine38-40 synthase [Gillisia mitskevichiae]|uniref:tRNA pseudouridine synthase A n=1 Tax=Gillisia mitskevichiae TaxID=270921 RepID=A0A495PRC4_9FLAO|nr:tRNA pseudouridine synthase A [Gillisia mitskevichiae]RKS53181.1 tRNA pseudouridine38-40 synthase [Gillisia mitskevichiae]
MQPKRFYYLIKVQFLGYRLHGWQSQPGFKTVEGLIKKTFKFILPDRRIKVLGSSRTDAMVSANESAFELFLEEEPLEDLSAFLKLFNKNLPPDIKALDIQEVDGKFNIIQDSKQKEYHYLFSFGEKNHPFCAPLMTNIQETLNIELMKEGAKLFKGLHHFQNFCVRSSGKSLYEREIIFSEIQENTIYTANFFPQKTYVFVVKGSGFLRYQIRLMIGTLIQLGKGELSLEDITESLKADVNNQMTYIAPASGLILHKIEFL